MSENHLVHFSAARRALALATEIDEVKDIRDKAEALRVYTKQAGEGLEMQNQCAEIKLRAERRVGEMLDEMEKNPGGRPKENLSHDCTGLSKLSDLGITRNQSSNWQRIASIPEEIFDHHIEQTKQGHKELTTISTLKLAKRLNKSRSDYPELPTATFDVILADPPWSYDFSPTHTRAIESHYPTMSLEAIKSLPIPAKENAVLFLWATAPKLQEALVVLNAWGFEYKTCAIWDKVKLGMGHWFRIQHELILLGTKGQVKPPAPELRCRSIIQAHFTRHSQKPEALYEVIEQLFPQSSYLELFARGKPREAWEVWGNEIESE